MAMTELERKLMAMSPEERKKAVEAVSAQMGMSEEAMKKAVARRKKRITELRDIANKDYELETDGKTGDVFVKGKVDPYGDIAKGLEELNLLDFDYMKNHDKIKSNKISDLTFSECCTELTFFLRGERFTPGTFFSALKDKTIYKLLDQMTETIDK